MDRLLLRVIWCQVAKAHAFCKEEDWCCMYSNSLHCQGQALLNEREACPAGAGLSAGTLTNCNEDTNVPLSFWIVCSEKQTLSFHHEGFIFRVSSAKDDEKGKLLRSESCKEVYEGRKNVSEMLNAVLILMFYFSTPRSPNLRWRNADGSGLTKVWRH